MYNDNQKIYVRGGCRLEGEVSLDGSKNSALSNWLLNFEKEQLKTVSSRYQTQKNHAGETTDDYKVKSFPFSKAEPKTDQ